mmetsp:Transcript_16862/g.35401  ORF Transcript_16862/g.35401 Transcript_16862/m.35401 type:complete len:416 (+) Transcript_16862:197-1444(+)
MSTIDEKWTNKGRAKRRGSKTLLFIMAGCVSYAVFTYRALYTRIISSAPTIEFNHQPEPRSMNSVISPHMEALINRTRFQLALNSSSPPTIYFCEPKYQDFFRLISDMFPEYQIDDESLAREKYWYKGLKFKESTEYDLFVSKYDYACPASGSNWLLSKFRGQFIWVTAESYPYPRIRGVPDDQRHHVVGPSIGGVHDFPLTYLQMVWWDAYRHILPPHVMVDGNLRPKGNRTHFLIYAQNNCVPHRNKAFGLLSSIGRAHHSGKCGAPKGYDNVERVRAGINSYNWKRNAEHYSNYRFCLVMEHSYDPEVPYYVTEKILLAFVGGCIPIYYGSPDVIFDMFNKNAFVFFNVSDPILSLELVKNLENNTQMYDEMISEPILANGNETVKKYFSFSDEIGNGWLKYQFRSKLNLLH